MTRDTLGDLWDANEAGETVVPDHLPRKFEVSFDLSEFYSINEIHSEWDYNDFFKAWSEGGKDAVLALLKKTFKYPAQMASDFDMNSIEATITLVEGKERLEVEWAAW